MLIHSKPIQLTRLKLDLPVWVRAPLYLAEGATCYVSYPKTEDYTIPECIITAFSPASWKDLWRIELDILDSPGALLNLHGLLSEHRIKVLCSESSTYYFDKYASLSFIVDCCDYSSGLDLDSERRARNDLARLFDLYTIIATELIDILLFPDGKTPRLRMKRVHSYYQQHRFHAGNKIEKIDKATVKKGGVRICSEYCGRLKKALGTRKSISTIVLADTKDRISRVKFIASDNGVVRIQVRCPHNSNAVEKVLKAIRTANFNILKSQLRRSDSAKTKGTRNRYSRCVMDLLLYAPRGNKRALQDKEIERILKEAINNDHDLRAQFVSAALVT